MKTLRQQIIRPIVLLLVTAVIGLTLATTFCIRMIITADMDKLSQDIVQSKASEIDYFLDTRVRQLESMVQLIQPEHSLEENLERIRMFAQVENTFESLGIVDSQGMKTVTTGAKFSIIEREYYQQLLHSTASTFISEPVESKDNQENIIILLTRLHDPSGKLEYLSGAISVDYIQNVLENSNTFNFFTRIINEDQNEILHAGQSSAASRQPVICALDSVRGWSLEVQIPDSFYYRHLIYVNAMLMILFLILPAVLLYFIRRVLNQNVAPVHELAETMKQVTLDNLQQVRVSDENQEMHDLSTSYNQMMCKISELISELETTEKAKKDIEYRALIQQIKPHFLYNTLETIQSMCLDYDDDKAENAIGLLAQFFRISLSSDAMFIPLQKELDQVESYLKIQLLRYAGQFEYSIDNQADGSAMFLRFTLQPLVENAIDHGIKNLSRKGWIRITVQTEDSDLIVSITNEACGIDSKRIANLNRLFVQGREAKAFPGYGLYNVNERLRLNFGPAYHLTLITQSDQVTVICRHPYRKEGSE